MLIEEIDFPKLLNYKQAAKLLGLTPITLRRNVSDGKLAHYKIGKNVRFSLEQLKALLREVPPQKKVK